MRRYPFKTALTLLLTALLLGVQPWIPGWNRYRFFDASSIVRAFTLRIGTVPLETPMGEGAKPPVSAAPEAAPKKAPAATVPRRVDIEDPSGMLRTFYQKLQRRERGENLTINVLHYGESPVSADLVTADIREMLQARFGDSGHGFCLLVKPWAWYEHRRISTAGSGWTIERVTNSAAVDGIYGIGGVSFRGNAGAHAEISLAQAGSTALRIHYLRDRQPGSFRVSAGEETLSEQKVQSDGMEDAIAEIPIPPETGEVRLDVVSGTVRIFGWELRKDSPGIVYSALGLNGAFIDVLGRRFRTGHLESLWRHEAPDLVVLNYGTNGLLGETMADAWFTGEVHRAFQRAKQALPAGASLLVMSPMDKGWRNKDGKIVTSDAYQQMIRLLREASLADGLPFFNTFEAMGGAGTMGRWYSREPRLVGGDLIHPTTGGGRIVAKLFVEALLREYAKYKSESGLK